MRRTVFALTLAFTGCAEIGLEPNGVPSPPASRQVSRTLRAASSTFGVLLIGR